MIKALFAFPLLLLFAGIAFAGPVSLSGADIEAIKKAGAEFATGPLRRISVDSACKLTAEQDCSAEAAITVQTAQGLRDLTVSKIGGVWKIGNKERDRLAVERR